jgi:hypothetical protein
MCGRPLFRPPRLATLRRAADGCCNNRPNQVAQPLLSWLVVEAWVPDHEVVKWFEFNGGLDDGKDRIIDIYLDESTVEHRHKVCASLTPTGVTVIV